MAPMTTPVLNHRKIKHLVSISLRNIKIPETLTISEISHIGNNKSKLDPSESSFQSSTSLDNHNHSMEAHNTQELDHFILSRCSFYDTFFVLQLPKSQTPFYISEISSECMNVDFHDINLMALALKDPIGFAQLSKSRKVKLRVFVRRSNHDAPWKVLLSRTIFMSNLMYVGPELDQLQHSSKNNELFISMTDGVFKLSQTTVQEIRQKLSSQTTKTIKQGRSKFVANPDGGVPMMDYESIMKLDNLKLCIMDIQTINYSLTMGIDKAIRGGETIEPPAMNSDFNDKKVQIRNMRCKVTDFRKVIELLRNNNYQLKKKLTTKKKILDRLKLLIYDDGCDDDNDNDNDDYDYDNDAIQTNGSSTEDGFNNEEVYEGVLKKEERLDKIKFKFDDDHNTVHQPRATPINQHHQVNSIISSIDSEIQTLKLKYHENSEDLQLLDSQITSELSQIFKTLVNIFPIIPLNSNPIEFSLLGLRLSNLCYFIRYPNYNKGAQNHHSADEDDLVFLSKDDLQLEIDACLGYVTTLVQLLSLYLGIPLKYPVISCGSYSVICDYVSALNDNNKVFPLHLSNRYPAMGLAGSSKKVILFKFEYGVSLLNKNIQQIMESESLVGPDQRNILGNLKMLLLYLASKDLGTP
ncbi:hypothetical protein DASC09_019010 [Saccharomycopsis crataegensis]|uniref:Uncharacterized protein n=1 Tax=Saccharomycopsis crataegensis TaxID=43959 RepID=A0AAV5QIY4_9ASCO|nr:hypothetical protein DASC09_019010 [Saccharomycopsis crataegensis]